MLPQEPLVLERVSQESLINSRFALGLLLSLGAHLVLLIWVHRVFVPPPTPVPSSSSIQVQLRAAPVEQDAPPSAKTPESPAPELEPTVSELEHHVEPDPVAPLPVDPVVEDVEQAPSISLSGLPALVNPEDLRPDSNYDWTGAESQGFTGVFDPVLRQKLNRAGAQRQSTQPVDSFQTMNNRTEASGDQYMSFDDTCFRVTEALNAPRNQKNWYRINCGGGDRESRRMMERVNKAIQFKQP